MELLNNNRESGERRERKSNNKGNDNIITIKDTGVTASKIELSQEA